MDYKMTGGNSRLAEEFAKQIGAGNIRLNTLVTGIDQSRGTVTVKTAGDTFKADAVICTAPINSLLQIKFNPPLPLAQTAAAEKLTYARICKNSVLYDERFWRDENFSMVSDVTSHFYFHSTQSQPGRQGILTSYAVGEKADVLASQSDERRMRIITNDLVDFDPRAPELARGIASYAWQRDPFTDGAYALYKPGQWFGIRPVLQRPHGSPLRRRTSRRLARLYGRCDRDRRSRRRKPDTIDHKRSAYENENYDHLPLLANNTVVRHRLCAISILRRAAKRRSRANNASHVPPIRPARQPFSDAHPREVFPRRLVKGRQVCILRRTGR
jgi:hypothetical protein